LPRRSDEPKWKTICVRIETWERLEALRLTLNEAFLDSPTAAVAPSDKTGEVTMPATVERLLDHYEAYRDRRKRSRGSRVDPDDRERGSENMRTPLVGGVPR